MCPCLADFVGEPTWSNGEYGYQEEAELTSHEDPIRLAFQLAQADDAMYEQILEKLAFVLNVYTSLHATVKDLQIAFAEDGEHMLRGKNVAIMSHLLNVLSVASSQGYYILRKEFHTLIVDEYHQALRDYRVTPYHKGPGTSLGKLNDAVERLAEEERQGNDITKREALVREVFLREYQVLLEEFVDPRRYTGRLRDTTPYPVKDPDEVELQAVRGMNWLFANYEFALTVDQVQDTLGQIVHRMLAILNSDEHYVLLKSSGNLLTRVLQRCPDQSKLGILIAWRKVLYELILKIRDVPLKAKIFHALKRLEAELKISTIPEVQKLITDLLIQTLRSKGEEDEERMRSLVALSALDASSAAKEGWNLYRSSARNELLRVAGVWSLGTSPSKENLRRIIQVLCPSFPLVRERNIDVLEIGVASLFQCRELFPDQVKARLEEISVSNSELADICSAYLTWLDVGVPNLPPSPPFTEAEKDVLERYTVLRTEYVPKYSQVAMQEQLMIDRVLYPVRSILPGLVEKGGRLALTTYSVVEAHPSLRGKRQRGGGFYDSVAGLASSMGNVTIRLKDLRSGSGYHTLLHEMGHASHYFLKKEREELYRAIGDSYQAAIEGRYCIDTYAETDEYEYFAQGREAYSCLVRDHDDLIVRYFKQRYGYEDINSTTRSWLKRKDQKLFSIVEEAIGYLEKIGDERISS